jgi:glucosamine 6-phosphate synthetase-like amidotransferase/phosphosugar isomerase protein
MERILEQDDEVRKVTEKYIDRENWLFLGRGYNYPTALEGALKLKEISYIHAEGMPAAEMKHGPIALINEGMPAVFIANKGRQYEKVMSNIQEVKRPRRARHRRRDRGRRTDQEARRGRALHPRHPRAAQPDAHGRAAAADGVPRRRAARA